MSSTLLARGAKEAADLVCCVHGTQDPLVSDIAFPLGRNNGQENVIAYSYGIAGNIVGRSPKNGGNGTGYCEDLGYTLTKTDQHCVAYAAFVQNSRDEVRYVCGDGSIAGALAASAGAKQQNYLLEKTDCLNLEQPQCWRVAQIQELEASLAVAADALEEQRQAMFERQNKIASGEFFEGTRLVEHHPMIEAPDESE